MEIRQPHNKELEALVLGTIIQNKFGYDEVREIVNEECFYNDFHRKVFRIFKSIEAKGEEPDSILIVQEYHKVHNEFKGVEIMNLGELSNSQNIYPHTLRLNDLAARRKIINLGYYLQNNGIKEHEDISDIANHANECLQNLYINETDSISTIRDAIGNVYDIIDKNRNSIGSEGLTGSPTGFEKFDIRSGGLQKSDLIVIGGETSQGKTSFALSLVNNSIKHGTKVAIYSMEMKKEQLAARLMAMESDISSSQLLYTPLEDWKINRLDKTVSSLCNSSIYFDDRSRSNIDVIINSIRKMVLKYDIDGAVIDYLQMLNVYMKGSNKEQQMADVARRLKDLAKELDIWIIALSQLSRNADNPRPNLNRLRDSGQIAEAADTVILLYRPEIYNRKLPAPFTDNPVENKAFIDVQKGRNMGIFSFLLDFNSKTTRFSDTSDIIINDTPEPDPF